MLSSIFNNRLGVIGIKLLAFFVRSHLLLYAATTLFFSVFGLVYHQRGDQITYGVSIVGSMVFLFPFRRLRKLSYLLIYAYTLLPTSFLLIITHPVNSLLREGKATILDMAFAIGLIILNAVFVVWYIKYFAGKATINPLLEKYTVLKSILGVVLLLAYSLIPILLSFKYPSYKPGEAIQEINKLVNPNKPVDR